MPYHKVTDIMLFRVQSGRVDAMQNAESAVHAAKAVLVDASKNNRQYGRVVSVTDERNNTVYLDAESVFDHDIEAPDVDGGFKIV